jgi:RNA polymerase sigma-70 factor, ECF subfamily
MVEPFCAVPPTILNRVSLMALAEVRRPASPPSRPTLARSPQPAQQAFREHAAFVAGLAHRLTGRSDEVDDIVQDVFVVAVRGLGALRDPDAVRPWLATIAVRVIRRRLRALRLRRWCGLDDAPEYESVAANDASPEDRALLGRIYALLDGMSADHRVAWCLRHVHGYELEMVAELCGCSLATAKRWIASAHAELQSGVNDG